MASIIARAILRVRHDKAHLDPQTGEIRYERGATQEAGNILTDGGRRTLHALAYGTATQRSSLSISGGLNWIALSSNSDAPAASDTSLVGELTSGGLERVQGTVALPTGTGVVTVISNEFTYTGIAPQVVAKACLFDAATGGHLAHEILFPASRVLTTSDILTLQFSITLT